MQTIVMQTKTMGDTPHDRDFRTAKSKIQCRGINKKEMGGTRKVKGRLPSDNPAAALPGYVE
jgi:hypothetical protein